MRVINSFRGNYDFLSNFFVGAPFIDCNEIEWKTTEHYYQAQKTFTPGLIMDAETPGDAKRIAHNLPIRRDWGLVKVGFMTVSLKMKFDQNPKYKELLIQTEGYKLVEGNWWHDNFWGDCYCDKCEDKKGKNMLGKLLMNLRSSYLIMGENDWWV